MSGELTREQVEAIATRVQSGYWRPCTALGEDGAEYQSGMVRDDAALWADFTAVLADDHALRDRLAQVELLWKAAQVEVEKWGSKYRDLEAQLATAQARGKQLEAELQQVRSWLEPSEGA